MSATARDTPNGWKNGWYRDDEDESIRRTVKLMARRLKRSPASVVSRINKLSRDGKFEIWESRSKINKSA